MMSSSFHLHLLHGCHVLFPSVLLSFLEENEIVRVSSSVAFPYQSMRRLPFAGM